jgi:hypothetical protein
MKNNPNTSNQNPKDVQQPLMSTGTSEPGFDWEKEGYQPMDRPAARPKIGETLIGDDGITGRVR